jgi:predicted ATPase
VKPQEATSARRAHVRESSTLGSDVRLFGPFRLDADEQRLWKGSVELKLRRKPFEILRFLTANALRLVTQGEIVEAVWGKNAISESLLRTHLGEVRRILGEGAIETVVGRGYRFVFAVEAEKGPIEIHGGAAPANLVGRSEEMDFLRHAFETALRERTVLFVTGDPGIGKSTIVDALLAELAHRGVTIATGVCVEQLGGGEPYLPVLAALGGACRAPGGERVITILGRHAPTWLAQMPGLVADEELPALHLRVQGATQARMLRELAEAFDVMAAEKPLVLVLEDLHWCDRLTTELVAMLGARREQARVLVIVTCRQAELPKGDALASTIAELCARKRALALHLENLTEVALGVYLSQRFSNHRFPADLASTIHGMTAGNPLFTVAVVDDLERRGTIQSVHGVWQLSSSVAEVARRRPDSVRQLIDIQIDRLAANEQRILEAGGFAGADFAADDVAHALGLPVYEADAVCERLAAAQRFLRVVSSEPSPDGTTRRHYGFVHALYRDAALARVPSATRRVWHRRVAETLGATGG